MNDNIPSLRTALSRVIESARERVGEPRPSDILKRDYEEAQKRSRNIALEKWGPVLEERIRRQLRQQSRFPSSPRKSMDMDRE